MEFGVEFYETVTGDCPVREFLLDLRDRDPDDFAAVAAGIARLRDRLFHRAPFSKPIGNGLFELRHVGKLNTRVIYFFVKGRRIIMLHGIRNKAQEILKRDRHVALRRRDDWLERHAK